MFFMPEKFPGDISHTRLDGKVSTDAIAKIKTGIFLFLDLPSTYGLSVMVILNQTGQPANNSLGRFSQMNSSSLVIGPKIVDD